MKTGGPAFPGTLLDWFAGQALEGWAAGRNNNMIENSNPESVAQICYKYADAMLAEKARREADHSGEANKMVEDHFRDAAKMTKLEAQREADHSEDKLGKVVRPATGLECVANERNQALDQLAALEAANRKLMEALEALLFVSEKVQRKGYFFAELDRGVVMARAVLAKHKEAKP